MLQISQDASVPSIHFFSIHNKGQSPSSDIGFHQNSPRIQWVGKLFRVQNEPLKHCFPLRVQPLANFWFAWFSGERKGSHWAFLVYGPLGSVSKSLLRILLRQSLLMGNIPASKGHLPRSVSSLLRDGS